MKYNYYYIKETKLNLNFFLKNGANKNKLINYYY